MPSSLLVGRSNQPVLLLSRRESALKMRRMCGDEPSVRRKELLGDTLGSRYQTAVIGQAGENLVRYATISHDGRHAGRGGSGAVMGSKEL